MTSGNNREGSAEGKASENTADDASESGSDGVRESASVSAPERVSERTEDSAAQSAPDSTSDCDSRIKQHHAELYQSARRELRRMARTGTIDTVALVNEAYLRARKGEISWESPEHFLASMTTIMRHVLVDYARQKGAARRGGAWLRVTTGALNGVASPCTSADLFAVDAAMTSLGEMSPRLEKLVELKVFGGLTVEEMATALDISKSTVSRDLRTASAYLRHTMSA